MANFVCQDDTLMGRSVDDSPQFMGASGGDSDAYKWWTKYWNRINVQSSRILASVSDYDSIWQDIADLDNTQRALLGNQRGTLTYLKGTYNNDPDYKNMFLNDKILPAWRETGNIWKRNIDLIIADFRQGLTTTSADSAYAAASELKKTLAYMKGRAFPVTKAQPGYTQGVGAAENMITQLNTHGNELKTAGLSTQADVQLATGKAVADIELQRAGAIALARGDYIPPGESGDKAGGGFNFLPLLIGAAAIGGGILLLKG